MLVLPGQGVLTLLLGIGLLGFPEKYKLQQRIVSQATVLRTLNRIRRRAGREPLVFREDKSSATKADV